MKRMGHHGIGSCKGWLAALVLFATGSALAAAPALLVQKCGGCHVGKEKLERISNIRKSPEGWDMTIVRMGVWHKVQVTRAERKALVKYLADTQGLAPEESAPYRALLERQPNITDVVPSEELGQMCGRCHSFGRVALQRRDTQEWRKLVHTHMGQFPSVEYSALGRDRNWFDLAVGETASKLGELYPHSTAAWTKWRRAAHRPPTGQWRVAGHRPGVGDYSGYMSGARAEGRSLRRHLRPAVRRRKPARRGGRVHRLYGLRMARQRPHRQPGDALDLRPQRRRQHDGRALVHAWRRRDRRALRSGARGCSPSRHDRRRFSGSPEEPGRVPPCAFRG